MSRSLVRIPFGEGLSRNEGALVVRPSSFRDVRNVHLTGRRAEFRKGIEEKALIAGATDILAIHPLRAALQSLIVSYNNTTRAVSLHRVAIDPSTLDITLTAVAGPMWTIPVTAPFPLVSITDSYGKAFIAHDETSFSLRQKTQVFDPATDTCSDLLYDLNPASPINWRWVRRWLSYIIGGGYGTDDVGPPDKRNSPEVVRISNPGDPEVLEPNNYFNAGQPGEPTVGGAPCKQGFVVFKEGEVHLITGTSYLDFNIELVDGNFGAVSGASIVEVGGLVYFWSAEGPRVTDGSMSIDLGLPLDLEGALPDEVLTAADLRYCHAVFRPDREEIEWIFPASGRNASWGYVLDLKLADVRQWSYRRYSQLVRCSGLLAGNVAFDPGDPTIAPYISLTGFAANAGSWYSHTLGWNNVNVANLPAGAEVEIWISGGPSAFVSDPSLPWQIIGWLTAAGASQTEPNVVIGNASNGQPYRHVAVRYKLPDGTYYPASQSSNPMDWPANTRASIAGASRPELTGATLAFEGSPSIVSTMLASWNNTGVANLDAGSQVEIWGMGGEFLGGPAIAPDTWQLEATIAASGATQSQGGVVIGQQRRHVAMRYKIGGQYYAHSADSSNPWLWPAGSRASALLDGPRPIPAFTWDVSSGFNRSPGTLTYFFPDANLAPAGTWSVEVYLAVWDSSKSWAPDTPDPSAWTLVLNQTFGGSQPPPSVVLGVSTLNSQYKLVYTARLKRSGLSFPANYDAGSPTLYPAASRIIIDCI